MENPPRAVKLPSPLERLELILLGLARREPVTGLCAQAGVSRELFYRWMRLVREAGLKALEAKAPGPKRIPQEKAPERALKLDGRVRRLEQENKRLRQERDRWKLLAETAKRIIRRQAWGPVPEPRSKKNAMPSPRAERSTCGSGESSGTPAPRPRPLPGAGGCPEAPTGGGSMGAGRRSDEGS